MYLEQVLNKFNDKRIKMFVDMDGVIADYDIGNASNFDKKRPLMTSISKLEKLSRKENLELYILSISTKDEGILQKNTWLDKYAPFFKNKNRIIISKESNIGFSAKVLKADYLKSVKRDSDLVIVFIDDDPEVIKEVKSTNPDIIILKDTALVD